MGVVTKSYVIAPAIDHLHSEPGRAARHRPPPPARPDPPTPTVLPVIPLPSIISISQPVNLPARVKASASTIRRVTARINAQVKFAVASVKTSGVFVT